MFESGNEMKAQSACFQLRTNFILVGCMVVVIFLNSFHVAGSSRLPRISKEDLELPRTSNRLEKLLPFLALVSFPESPCVGDDGEQGICLSKKKCANGGGTGVGTCAWGYGTCCFVTTGCGSTPSSVRVNGTHLVQSSPFRNLCRYEIPKKPGVCQVRLDFINFQIEEGSRAMEFGDCVSDTLTISGATNAVAGPLCGDLTEQHMYLDYGGNEKINLDIYLEMQNDQKWDIKVTMIKCDSLEKAPDGCLQYFTDQRAMVKSFNYRNMHQLNNQDYTVCVRANIGMKKINWKSCGGLNDFFITGNPPVAGNPPLGFQLSGSACTTDWVMILGVDKYCGSLFPSVPVSSCTQPFIMQVHFDGAEIAFPANPPPNCGGPNNPCPLPEADENNTGFCLMYAQSPQ